MQVKGAAQGSSLAAKHMLPGRRHCLDIICDASSHTYLSQADNDNVPSWHE